MSDDGTSFTIDIPVTGKDKIDAASASVDVLAARLDAASKAVRAGEASYRVAESSADRAAKALERVGLAASEQRLKLQQAQRAGDDKATQRATNALELLAQREGRAAAAVVKTKTALDAEAKSLDKLKGDLDKVDKAHKAAQEAAEKTEPAFATIGRGLGKLGGPLAEIGEKITRVGEGFAKLQKGLGGAGLYAAVAVAIAAVAASMVAVAAAAVGATAKLLSWAVGLADAKGHAERLAQAMLWGSKTGGAALNDQIGALSRKLPLTREEITETARGLASMGLRGKALNDTLERSARLAARLKFGPQFEDEMLSLEQQSKVFQENLAQLFGGLKVDGLLRSIQKLGGMLDASSASGKAVKVVFEGLFQPLVDWLAKSETKIQIFLLDVEILALKAAIQFKKHFSTIKTAVEVVAVGAAVVFGVVAAAIGVVVAALGAVVVAFGAVAIAFYKLEQLGERIGNFFKSFSLVDFGKAMIDGLVQGIENGASAVLNSMRGVVTRAVDAAKKALGIASPSKVFAEIGMQTGAGMEQGVQSSAPGVQRAMEGMSAPPTMGGSGPTAAAGGTSVVTKSGHDFSGANFSFTLNGVSGADDAVERIKDVVLRLVEGDVAQLGGVAPA